VFIGGKIRCFILFEKRDEFVGVRVVKADLGIGIFLMILSCDIFLKLCIKGVVFGI